MNRRHRRRNPSAFAKSNLENIGGALIGVAVVRALPGMVPASMTSALPQNSFTPAIMSGLATLVASWGASKFLPAEVAKGVAIGGGALVASQLLTAFGAPTRLGPFNFGVSGIGDIVQTQGFTVPDRSMRPALMPGPVAVGSGMGMYTRRRR